MKTNISIHRSAILSLAVFTLEAHAEREVPSPLDHKITVTGNGAPVKVQKEPPPAARASAPSTDWWTFPKTAAKPEEWRPDARPHPAPAKSEEFFYLVQDGDAVSKIAAMFRTTVKKLAVLNGLEKNPDRIRRGQVLSIPGSPEVIVVPAGSSLSKIAKSVGIDESLLADANDIKDRNRLRAGQWLKLYPPARSAAAPRVEGAPVIAKATPPGARKPAKTKVADPNEVRVVFSDCE